MSPDAPPSPEFDAQNGSAAPERRILKLGARAGAKPSLPCPRTLRSSDLYLTASGAAAADRKPNLTTIERRLSALAWNYAQCGQPLSPPRPRSANVMCGSSSNHASAEMTRRYQRRRDRFRVNLTKASGP
jgi:hypothetical protein